MQARKGRGCIFLRAWSTCLLEVSVHLVKEVEVGKRRQNSRKVVSFGVLARCDMAPDTLLGWQSFVFWLQHHDCPVSRFISVI